MAILAAGALGVTAGTPVAASAAIFASGRDLSVLIDGDVLAALPLDLLVDQLLDVIDRPLVRRA